MIHYRDLGDQFMQLHVLRRLYAQKTMPEHDLHMGQLPVLEYVSEHEGCTQVEIAQALSVSPASIATSTKRLQRGGLLEKRGDEGNLRIKRLFTTEEGRARCRRGRECFDEMDRRTYEGIGSEELEQLSALLSRINRNVATAINESWAGEVPSMQALMQVLMQEMDHAHGRDREGPHGPHAGCPHRPKHPVGRKHPTGHRHPADPAE